MRQSKLMTSTGYVLGFDPPRGFHGYRPRSFSVRRLFFTILHVSYFERITL